MSARTAGSLRVGLTGGVACGKSTVAELFAARGVPVLDADRIAREVVAPGTALLQRLFDQFGPQVLAADGSLDRAALRRLIFANAARREQLEALLHPAIHERTEELARSATGPYQLHVIPLLLETGAAARFDRVLVVDCPEELQWQRLMARPGITESEARAMIAAQASRAGRRAIADDLILNEGAIADLGPQVDALHTRYLALGAASQAQ